MSLIPIEFYTGFFHNFTLIVVLLSLVHTSIHVGDEIVCLRFNRSIAVFFLVFVIIYMGVRPISGSYFGDMATYARYFNHLANGGELSLTKDVGFLFFIGIASKFMSVELFFLICSLLYLVPVYFALKRWHPDYIFLALLIFVASFSFWTYGTNGIRAGLATSFFIWALSYRHSLIKMFGLFILSVLFHNSMMLPLLAFGLTFIYNKPKTYLSIWVLSIFLSASMGGVWEIFFAGLGFGDDRLTSYLTSNEFAHQFRITGFRWDFLLYSFCAVFAGAYYIFKLNFKDIFYFQVFNTYLLTNAFWILVIRSSFSNRFAYLSWFLMAIIIIYPLLKQRMWRYQYSTIGLITLIYFSFTYVMHYVVEMREPLV